MRRPLASPAAWSKAPTAAAIVLLQSGTMKVNVAVTALRLPEEDKSAGRPSGKARASGIHSQQPDHEPAADHELGNPASRTDR